MDEINELIAEAKNGNGEAFEKICKKYAGLINSMSRKYSDMCQSHGTENEDFLQEAKMAFYKATMTYDAGEKNVSFGAYAKVCIRNRLISCIRMLNSKKRRKSELGKEYSDDSLQENVLKKELGEKMMRLADDKLSPYEKKIFALYAEGLRAKEISGRTGKSEKSVNNAIYRIKSKLKRTVKDDT
ncbi:MAG: sigma-70 family RNA polymerase sigma factor [Eubacteriales bacterium]